MTTLRGALAPLFVVAVVAVVGGCTKAIDCEKLTDHVASLVSGNPSMTRAEAIEGCKKAFHPNAPTKDDLDTAHCLFAAKSERELAMCSTEGQKATAEGKSNAGANAERVLPEDEVKRLEADLTKRLSDNLARTSCPRSLLPGVVGVAGGDAEHDLLALAHTYEEDAGYDDAWRACESTAFDHAAALKSALAKDAPADALALKGDIAIVEKACARPIDDAFARTSAHASACSPFRAAKRVFPAPEHFRAVVHASLVHARVLAHDGNIASATSLLFEVVQALQDLHRGGSALVPAMHGVVNERLALDQLDAVLAEKNVTAHDLDAAAAGLDVLLMTQPTRNDVLIGEQLAMSVAATLPELKKAWAPPGGFPKDVEADASLDSKDLQGSPRDMYGMQMEAMLRGLDQTARACPPSSSAKACRDAITPKSPEPPSFPVMAAKHILDPHGLRAAVAEGLVDRTLRAEAGPAARLDMLVARLAAARVNVEIARMSMRSKACPARDAFDREPLKSLVNPPQLGDALVVTAVDGGFDLAMPAWVNDLPPEARMDGELVGPWHARCR